MILRGKAQGLLFFLQKNRAFEQYIDNYVEFYLYFTIKERNIP